MSDNTRMVLKRDGVLSVLFCRQEYFCLADISKVKDGERVPVIRQGPNYIVVCPHGGTEERWPLDSSGGEELMQKKVLPLLRETYTELVAAAIAGARLQAKEPLEALVKEWPELQPLLNNWDSD